MISRIYFTVRRELVLKALSPDMFSTGITPYLHDGPDFAVCREGGFLLLFVIKIG